MIVSKPHAHRQSWSLRDYLKCFRRRRLAIAIPALSFLALGLVLYTASPRRYVAEAVVALDVRRIQILSTEAVLSPLPQESPVLRTELDVINSRLMAERVLDRLDQQGIAPPPPSVSFLDTLRHRFRGTDPVADIAPAGSPAAMSPDRRRQRIDQLLDNLKVSNDGRSYTIFIVFTAASPAYAAVVANAFGEAYLDYQTDVQAAATRHASDWLGAKLSDLRRKLEVSESSVETFRRSAGMVISEGASLEAQRLNTLNTALIQARADRAAAEARLETAKGLVQSDDGLDSFAEVLKSPIIQELRAEQAKVDRQLTEYADTGAVKANEIPALRSQQASLRDQIKREVDRVVASLANEIAVEQHKEDALQLAFQQAETAQSTANTAQLQLNQLDREASANRTIYESYLTRYKQTIEQDGLAVPEARLISRAEPPGVPASPRLMPFVMLSLLAGCGLGIALALLRETFDSRIRSRRDLEDATELPVFDLIPLQRRPGPMPVHAAVVKQPDSPFGEAARRLRSTLFLAPTTRRAQILALTSADAGDGKTTLCIALARSMALAGQKVILIDADLRNPTVAEQMGVTPPVSLLDLIRDGQRLDEAIASDKISPSHFIAARPDALTAEHLLGEPGFQDLLSRLRKRYDRIIIDTGAVRASTDAAQLGALVDAVLLVTRWGRTTRSAVLSSIRHLAFRGTPVSGLILNGVSGYRREQDEIDQLAGPAPAELSPPRPARPYEVKEGLGLAREA